MNRLKLLSSLLLAGALTLSAQTKKPIQLHCDLDVDPPKEKEMLANYAKVFKPAISKQPGFVEVELMKMREVIAGKVPNALPYRINISFQTEEQRKTWVATDVHQQAWPTIEKTLKGEKARCVLYDLK
jgi:heme-degrading monooxygenase HmoA